MGKIAFASMIAALALCGAAHAQTATPAPETPPVPPAIARTIDQLQQAALASDHAYDIVESLVTEVGPRIAGSPAEARARDWALAMLRADGFANARIEPYVMHTWDATAESAELVAPYARALSVVALGGSPSTPPGGLEGDIVRFESLADMEAAPDDAVRGKIVFIDEHMTRTQDGSGYPVAVRKRGLCAARAGAKGAIACLIRSVGTNSSRFPHQGGYAVQNENGHLPAMALAPPDADVLTRLIAAHGSARVRLHVDSVSPENAPSGNVIAEIPGRERPNEIVLIAAHLDSWDAGFGAQDDGAGVAIITAAAKLIRDLPRRPRRTIRILLAGAEENSGAGEKAYYAAHSGDGHILAAESDFGSGRVWRLGTRFNDATLPYASAFQTVLAPLGVIPGENEAGGGADISSLHGAGVAILDLEQDGSHYFDIHHTADDTLENINPADLRQNVAVWASAIYLAAESDWAFVGIPSAPEE